MKWMTGVFAVICGSFGFTAATNGDLRTAAVGLALGGICCLITGALHGLDQIERIITVTEKEGLHGETQG